MKRFFCVMGLIFIYTPLAHSMQRLAKTACSMSAKRFPENCRFMSTKTTSKFIESIRCSGNKQVQSGFFNHEISFKKLLKIIKTDLYETGNYPHVDPTSGNPGYCQLIAGFLDTQIAELNSLDLENCSEEATKRLLPLVKAYTLQEYHCPKNYESLNTKTVMQRLGKDLGLLKEDIYEDYLKYSELQKKETLSAGEKEYLAKRKKDAFSNRKAELILDRTQESFMGQWYS